jgi:ketosteroid isomerase-like protein
MSGGRVSDPETAATLAGARRFLDAFARHDVDGVMAAMTDDCVFENTWPAPDGERHVGQAAVQRGDRDPRPEGHALPSTALPL